jgi:FkbM family methyltransferase
MLRSLRTNLFEFARCTRHNLLHLKVFQISYSNGHWHVRDGDVELVVPEYPYLAFHDIEGYLFDGKWRPMPGETVIDVGGCFGEYALYASKRVGPTGRVLMLEPDPANIEVAQRLFALNGNPTNIEIVKAGLWSTPGKLRFNAGQSHQSAVATVDAVGAGHTIEIDVHSLASLAETYKLDRMDLVKMDIEGAELEVMAGAPNLPPGFKPRYAIASYHIVDGKQTAETLLGVFSKLGYHARNGYPEHLTTWASPSPLE